MRKDSTKKQAVEKLRQLVNADWESKAVGITFKTKEESDEVMRRNEEIAKQEEERLFVITTTISSVSLLVNILVLVWILL